MSGITRTPRTPSSGVTRTPKSGGGGGASSSLAALLGTAAGSTTNIANAFTGSSGSSSSGGGSSSGGSSSSSGGSSGGGYTASSSGGGKVASSSAWGCPSGATLVSEPGGTGNLVCRWNHNGGLFAARPVGGAVTAPSPVAAAPVNTTPVATPTASEWLQSAADTFASNPQAMLADQLKRQHGDTGGNALYGMLEGYGDAMNAMYLAQRGTSLESGGTDESLKYMEDYWKALQTPGARIDTGSALDNIFAAPEGSPLQSYLTTGAPEKQANNTLNLIAGAVNTGYNPVFANAVMERLRLERDRYLGESARNPDVGSFITYLNANNLGRQNLLG